MCSKGNYDGLGGGHRLVLQLENRMDELGRLPGEIDAFCREHGVGSKTGTALKMALDEFLANVISHAFPSDETHTFECRLQVADGELAVEIEDAGRPFNPLERDPPDTELELEEREVGGLGIHIAKHLVDDISYRRVEDRNLLTFRCGSG